MAFNRVACIGQVIKETAAAAAEQPITAKLPPPAPSFLSIDDCLNVMKPKAVAWRPRELYAGAGTGDDSDGNADDEEQRHDKAQDDGAQNEEHWSDGYESF